MSKEIFALSSGYLKKVVPLLMKYQVPATPPNYALWYTYVANADSELAKKIDDSIRETGALSTTLCEELYSAHVADEKVKELDEFQQGLQALALEMGNTMQDTLKDTDTFQSTLDKTFSQLARVDEEALSMEETVAVVRKAMKGSNALRQSTDFFKNQLAEAQKEISRLEETLNKANEEALHDALTGIYNRRAFDTELKFLLTTPPPKGFSLLLCDLDHFKRFNDTYGHLMGDQVLKLTAKRLSDYCRDGIKAYRFGGEEFALLVPNRPLSGACRVAETIRATIDKLAIKDKRTGRKLDNISISIGVATFENGESIRDLISRADSQLYDAKKLGRNRVMPVT